MSPLFTFVLMRKWDFQATSQESKFLAAEKSKRSFQLSQAEGLEEVRGSLCLGDCLSGSGEAEGEIRKCLPQSKPQGSRKARRRLWEGGVALAGCEEVRLGSRNLPGDGEHSPWGWSEGRMVFCEQSSSWKLRKGKCLRRCACPSLLRWNVIDSGIPPTPEGTKVPGLWGFQG